MPIPKLLIDEQPLQVLRSLAVAVGLNEAIILQQLHYEMRLQRHVFEGVSWVYYTYEQWQKQDFPFWSTDTIKRAIHRLEELGVLTSTMRFNHSAIDKRKWYTLNYAKLEELSIIGSQTISTVQNASTTMQDLPIDDAKESLRQGNVPPLSKIPTKKTTKDPLPTGEEPAREAPKPQLTLVKPTKPARLSRRCPPNYTPSEHVYTWASEQHPGIDVHDALATMKDHEFKNGLSDWDAALRNWIRREVKLDRRHRVSTPPSPTTSALPAWFYGKD